MIEIAVVDEAVVAGVHLAVEVGVACNKCISPRMSPSGTRRPAGCGVESRPALVVSDYAHAARWVLSLAAEPRPRGDVSRCCNPARPGG